MTLKTATIEDLLSWKPCMRWSENKIREIAGERNEFTALDILCHPHITSEDKMWVVLRPELVGKQESTWFIEDCIAHVMDTYDSQHDPRVRRTQRLVASARKDCAEGIGSKCTREAWLVVRALRWSIWGNAPTPGADRAEAWRVEGDWQVKHLYRILEE